MNNNRLEINPNPNTLEINSGVPEFETLLNNFTKELAKLDDYSGEIIGKVYQLRNFSEPNPESPQKQSYREDIIGRLEENIDRMVEYNLRLKEIKEGLIKLVG